MSLLAGGSGEVRMHKTSAEQEAVKGYEKVGSGCRHDNDLGDIRELERSCYVSKERPFCSVRQRSISVDLHEERRCV